MALAKLSEMFSAVKVKIGGTVFQGYRGSTLIKNRGYQKGKFSAPFQQSKAIFSQAATTWKSLTPSEIAAWNAAAVNFPYTNKFGDSVTPSGYQLYVSLYINAYSINKSPLTTPPTPQVLLPILGDECEILGMQTEKVKWTGPLTSEYIVKVFLSDYVTPSSNRPPKSFKQIYQGDSSRGEHDITGAMREAVFGSEFVNGCYWYKLTIVHNVSYQQYGDTYIKVIKNE